VLGPAGRNGIAVGIEGWYDALEPVMRSYGAAASGIYFRTRRHWWPVRFRMALRCW
jgi:hypothetical protein